MKQQKSNQNKKPYQTPKIVVYGSIEQLTWSTTPRPGMGDVVGAAPPSAEKTR